MTPPQAIFLVVLGATLFLPSLNVSDRFALIRPEWLVLSLALLFIPELRRLTRACGFLWLTAGITVIAAWLVTAQSLVGEASASPMKFLLWPLVLIPYAALGAYAFNRRGMPTAVEERTLVAFTVVLAAVGWLQFLDVFQVNSWLSPLYLGYESRGKQLDAIGVGRAFGTVGNANAYAALVVVLVLLVASMSFTRHGRVRLGTGVALVAALSATVVTLSRTGAVLAVLGALCLFATMGSKGRGGSPALGVGAIAYGLLAAAAVWVVVPDVLAVVSDRTGGLSADRYAVLLNVSAEDPTLNGRTTKWAAALDARNELGIASGWYGSKSDFKGLDNEPLRYLLALGVVGAASLVCFWWGLVQRVMRSRSPASQRLTLAAIVLAVMFSLTGYFFASYQLPAVLILVVVRLHGLELRSPVVARGANATSLML